MSPIEIIEARSAEDFAEGRILIEEYAETLGVDLCFQNFSDEIESLAKAYGTHRGCLLLARKNSELAGCVAVRSRGDVVCEMKRLYVRPQYRGVGLGRLLARTIILRARQLGYSRMILVCRTQRRQDLRVGQEWLAAIGGQGEEVRCAGHGGATVA